MSILLQWGGHPAVHRLGWTLLHFLWQGAVIAGLFAAAQTGRRSSSARYWTGCLALALMLAAPVVTFIALGAERTVPAAPAVGGTRPASPRAVAETGGARVVKGQMGQMGPMGQPRAAFAPAPNHNPDLNPDLNPNLNPNLNPSLLSQKLIPGFVLAWSK